MNKYNERKILQSRAKFASKSERTPSAAGQRRSVSMSASHLAGFMQTSTERLLTLFFLMRPPPYKDTRQFTSPPATLPILLGLVFHALWNLLTFKCSDRSKTKLRDEFLLSHRTHEHLHTLLLQCMTSHYPNAHCIRARLHIPSHFWSSDISGTARTLAPSPPRAG